MKHSELLTRYRISLAIFLTGLVLSGVTAFPLVWELDLLCNLVGVPESGAVGGLHGWLAHVREGLRFNAQQYPFMAYGTDWLAFAHLMIAVFFIPAWQHPEQHRSTLWCGIAACALVFPLAHIAGPFRGIPFAWRMIDCSFGFFGAIPLFYCLKMQKLMAAR
jgi:hypothetical protein